MSWSQDLIRRDVLGEEPKVSGLTSWPENPAEITGFTMFYHEIQGLPMVACTILLYLKPILGKWLRYFGIGGPAFQSPSCPWRSRWNAKSWWNESTKPGMFSASCADQLGWIWTWSHVQDRELYRKWKVWRYNDTRTSEGFDYIILTKNSHFVIFVRKCSETRNIFVKAAEQCPVPTRLAHPVRRGEQHTAIRKNSAVPIETLLINMNPILASDLGRPYSRHQWWATGLLPESYGKDEKGAKRVTWTPSFSYRIILRLQLHKKGAPKSEFAERRLPPPHGPQWRQWRQSW